MTNGVSPAAREALALPLALALAGLGTCLILDGVQRWPIIAFWLATLALTWLTGRIVSVPAAARPLLALASLLILFQARFVGGWYLIPANVVWLFVEWRARARATPRPGAPKTAS